MITLRRLTTAAATVALGGALIGTPALAAPATPQPQPSQLADGPDDSGLPPTPPGATRAAIPQVTPPCDGDGQSGPRVQMLYVRGDAQPDRLPQLRATFVQRAAEMNGLFVRSSDAAGSRREIWAV